MTVTKQTKHFRRRIDLLLAQYAAARREHARLTKLRDAALLRVERLARRIRGGGR